MKTNATVCVPVNKRAHRAGHTGEALSPPRPLLSGKWHIGRCTCATP